VFVESVPALGAPREEEPKVPSTVPPAPPVEVKRVEAPVMKDPEPVAELVPPKPPSPPEGVTFTIRLERLPDSKGLGVQVHKGNLQYLLVEAIGEDAACLVPSWNNAHKDRQVRVGDKILEVNGISGMSKMLSECKNQEVKVLEMTVKRETVPELPGNAAGSAEPAAPAA